MPRKSYVWSAENCGQITAGILKTGVIHIRDVDAGESPFLYTSRYVGPVYGDIKELVSLPIFADLVAFLANKVKKELSCPIQFVMGTETGGIVPARKVAEKLLPFTSKNGVLAGYVRKKAKDNEWLVGITGNPRIQKGDWCVLVDESVNFGTTSVQSVRVLREAGYRITHVACFLWYENPRGIEALKREGIEVIYLFTMAQLLDKAQEQGLYPVKVIDQCRKFLRDPVGWSEKHQTLQRSRLIVLGEEDGPALFQKVFLHTAM
ncbi:MAG: hypothetical protein HY617_01285 [Candidatus Sungbacteria bacterium]|nr:hypothetical protein [Candidatus Sungbacteria bacterium]